MVDADTKPAWKKRLAGGFAYMTAPFAVHPNDRKSAAEAVKLASLDGVTQDEFVNEAKRYLETASGWPTDIDQQILEVIRFTQGKLG